MHEEGPFDAALKLRTATGIEHASDGSVISAPSWNPLQCLFCTSIWISAILYWLPAWVWSIFGASGFAVLTQKLLEAFTEAD